MDEGEVLSALKELVGGDNEISHCRADEILCAFLRELGYGEIVDVFESIDKWYA